VLAKNTCYAPQPANWKLSSCADFYLEIDKLTDIGAQAWKTDVNNFIKYNIRDVELVKELVDKFALIDFLLVIQNDLAGINLNSATHNSMVLLYYLKTHYPNVILPDNPGYLYLEDDLVNLKQTYLKIKAAHVVSPTSGIHHNVSIFDFAGLYPSIFRTFNICPSTLNETEGAEIDDIIMWNMIKEGKATSTVIKEYNFACKFKQDKKGIYPEVLEDLTAKRKIHKSKLKELKAQYGDKSREYLLALYRSDVLKQVSNSLFGVGAFNSFCIFNPKVSAAVTSVSRKAIKYVEQLIIDKGYNAIYGDTDSILVSHPEDVLPEDLGKELNNQLKIWIEQQFPNLNLDNYCMNLEYEKTLKTFVMKDAKKKYYGLLADGSFYCKGFDIIQHSLSKKVKEMIKEVYLLLMNNPGDVAMAKDKIKEIKKVFYKLTPNELGNELKIAKNLVDYDSDIQHIRAAKYSNQHLGTNFDAGDAGKLVYLIPKSNNTFPATDVIFLDGDMKLPEGFIVDYDKHWKKFFIDKIKLLDDITIMKIDRILSPNASLDMFL
jgi:DNA polymerase elongation subunit (family B)